MTIQLDYEAEMILAIPYQEIVETMVKAVLEHEQCPFPAEVNVVLTDNEQIREVNYETRGIDAVTDVLSFPMIEYHTPADFSHIKVGNGEYFNMESGELLLGDMMIAVERMIEQAQEYGHSQTRELAFLITHSMLHLMGYDHIEESERIVMEAKQATILTAAGYVRESASGDQVIK